MNPFILEIASAEGAGTWRVEVEGLDEEVCRDPLARPAVCGRPVEPRADTRQTRVLSETTDDE